jgi:hypothetical protein
MRKRLADLGGFQRLVFVMLDNGNEKKGSRFFDLVLGAMSITIIAIIVCLVMWFAYIYFIERI